MPEHVIQADTLSNVTVLHTDESLVLVEHSPETAVDSGETRNLMTGASEKWPRTKSAKLQRDYNEHPLLPGCGSSCNRKCSSKSVDRLAVHKKFWEMCYDERKAWIAAHVKLSHVNRHRVDTSVRNCTRIYTGSCWCFGVQKFFLTTLGLTCDKAVTTAVSCENAIRVAGDKRGKHEPANEFSDGVVENVKAHIESFHPAISHYRREHAPFRRYISQTADSNQI